ncbi:MAG: hypothetical protein Nkreftii_001544 [Candidatus Nitrospira kreftii]|uniref:Uncharacterized protein n=1 Tax=Candidatus Nitrospira kreftii TaxID=2652173 RepID=A0A7S8FD82_9BACT|nr:MAG: hypothetical protein Nkreftii_001544 [Candidatus Nitrospira kreftii]
MSRSSIMVIAAILAVVGITPAPRIAAEPTSSADKVVKEAQETVEATREYTAQQKEIFQRKAQEELVAIQEQILGLRGKIAKASESTRGDLQKSLNELEKKKDGVKEKLDELKSTGDAKWHELREGMHAALNELKYSYRKLLSHLP